MMEDLRNPDFKEYCEVDEPEITSEIGERIELVIEKIWHIDLPEILEGVSRRDIYYAIRYLKTRNLANWSPARYCREYIKCFDVK